MTVKELLKKILESPTLFEEGEVVFKEGLLGLPVKQPSGEIWYCWIE